MEIDKGRKGRAVTFLKQAAKEKEISLVYSRKEILKNQLGYMDKTMWILQVALYFLAALLVARLYALGTEREGVLKADAVVAMMAGAVGIVSMMGICHAFYSDMAELSGSCYFNVSQMTMFQLVYYGTLNLGGMFAGIFFLGFGWQIPFVQISLYVLVPFLFTQCCALGAALTKAGRKSPGLACLVGAFAAISCGAAASFPAVYRTSALAFWEIAFGVEVAAFGWQIKRLFHMLGEGEILCMN